MHKVKKLTIFTILLLSIVFVFASCNKDYSYTVTFETNGGSAIDPIIVNNENLSAIPVAPTKEGYTFAGWYLDPELQNNAEEALSAKSSTDIKVYAKWIKKTYTVNFLANNGTLASGEIQQTIEHGNAANAPVFTKVGHTLSWDKAFDNIISDTTITAVWTKKTYTVTFKNWDNTVLKTETVSYGDSATAPANPTKAKSAQYSYSFSSWDKAFNNITENTEIIAQYYQALNNYTVTFSSGGVYQEGDLTQIVAYGGSAIAPVFTKENYTLSWSQSFDNITSDITIFGQWSHIEGQETELESIWEAKEAIFLEMWSYKFFETSIEDNYNEMGIAAIRSNEGLIAVECENEEDFNYFLYNFYFETVRIEGTNIVCITNYSVPTILTKEIVKSDSAYYDEDYTTLIRYIGSGEFTVASGVTHIGDSAFDGNNVVTKINLPSSIERIGNYAFKNCYLLATINIPESVNEIGKAAFKYCSDLNAIILPSQLKSIEEDTFMNCESLTAITIPDTVKYIDYSAFESCSLLQSININSNLIKIEGYVFSDTAWYNALPDGQIYINDVYYGYKGTFSGSNITLREGTKGIAGNAFSDNTYEITSVNIPDGVEYIGKYAFYYCCNLTSIALPSSIKSIGEGAFKECYSLESIVIPYGMTKIENDTFYGCSSLISVTLPDSITEIGVSAFYGCFALSSITLPNNIIEIRENTFYRCSALAQVTLPSGLLKIEEKAFYQCQLLEEIEIPDSVSIIGKEAFIECSSLVNITLPSNLIKIAKSVFSGCSNLSSITIPNGVVKIEQDAFSECNISSIAIPASVEIIESYAFFNCKNLTAITVDENNEYLKSLDGNLYTNDGKVLIAYAAGKTDTSFVIPESVLVIEHAAFYGENNLTSLSMPSNLKTIGDSAFAECTGLTSLVISNTVETIGRNAFYNCSGLTSIIFSDSLTKIGTDFITGCSSLTSINLSNTQITNLVSFTFYNVQNLVSITLPSTLTTMNASTVYMCPNLISLIIPLSVINIDQLAFTECSNVIIYVQVSSKPTAWNSNWNARNYPVVYNSVPSADNTYVERVNKTGSTPAITKAPLRQGYIFDGWYTSADFSGTKYNTLSAAPIDTIYSKWLEENP